LLPELRDRGQLVVPTHDLDDVDRWRRAVRCAVRSLGWHVRTGVTHQGTAWAIVEDYPHRGPDDAVEVVARALLDVPRRPKS
jgi:hypothetical protein